jgi:predicted ATPase/class 3 adenylate cyclase/ribosomal protein S7
LDIAAWLRDLGLARYEEAFRDNDIVPAVLPELTDQDLKDLGVTLGHRRLLLKAIRELSESEAESDLAQGSPTTQLPTDLTPRREAERRQLTVMFCDLVGSTALSARLDPEDMREVIHTYQNAVAGEITRFEGHVAKFMGDGVLAYFGYPQAHEDEAERAVRAGLAVVAAVAALMTPAGEPVAARIGIATGLVVVGDLVGKGAAQEEAVVGETPNLASRLQEAAAPDSVVVAPTTYELLGGLFELEGLGAKSLKGFAEPIDCWRVLGERTVESRFEAARGGKLSHFVGRAQELSLLEERWTRVHDGEGQVVLLTGEAGIGKSRLTRALMERLADEPHTRLRYQCSPHHVNSAFHPFIAQLERAAGFEASERADAKRAKLEALLGQATNKVNEVLPLLGSLLSLPLGADMVDLELEPKRWRQLTFEALLDQLAGLAARQPVLMIFEDAHWADPTSLELLSQMVDRVQQLHILSVITARPEFRSQWPGQSHVTMLTLNRLGRRQGAEIVADITGGRALPDVVLDQIVARTDGVPLFVEELTKAVLESGLLEHAGERYVLKGELAAFAIPSTLQDSLMARLDRLAPVKEVAQIGATIGREFQYRLIADVSSLKDEKLRDALDQLAGSELLFCRGSPPDASYQFKHALMQDAAYGSLLRAKRQEIHQRIAAALEGKYPQRAETEPEVLAHHYTEGGLIDAAVPYWQRAGKHAAERSADAEAHEHLRKALKLLEDLPNGQKRREWELETLIALGPVLMNLKGSASPEVRDAYLRARSLCDRVGQPSQRFPVLWGLWLHNHIAGESRAALDLAREAMDLAKSLSGNDFLLQALHASWTTHGRLAEFEVALAHADQGLALYNVDQHRHHAFTYGSHDPGVCAALNGAVASWFLGHPDQANRLIARALELADAVAHSFTKAETLAYVALVCLLRREPERALPLLDELIGLSFDSELILWRANGQILRSWAFSEMGRASEVLSDFREALEQRQSMGSQLRSSLYLAAMAHALARTGKKGEAERAIEQALGQVEETNERTWETVVHWVRGEILAIAPETDLGRAAACYQEASEIARRQGAKSMELRATLSLARLWLNEGRNNEGRDLLAPVYGWFTEGFDTADLKEAKTLLDKLR